MGRPGSFFGVVCLLGALLLLLPAVSRDTVVPGWLAAGQAEAFAAAQLERNFRTLGYYKAVLI